MAFYKFNWSKKGEELVNNIRADSIETEEIEDFITLEIKKEDSDKEEINEEVLLLAIKHFIDTSFKKDNDLNKMGYDRFDDVGGDSNYNYSGIIVDMITNNYMDILNQRFIEQLSLGVEKTIPLSFYFDLSGSMYEHTAFLAKIAFLLLKNGISILYGFNNFVNGVVLASDGVKTIEELTEIFEGNEDISVGRDKNSIGYISKKESRDLNIFLQKRKAEKCVIWSDFDPYKAICELSQNCKVYWFCFEKRYNHPGYDFKEFKGNVFYTERFDSMKVHFLNMDNSDYVENQKRLILNKKTQRRR